MFPLKLYKKSEMPLGSRRLRLGCAGRDVWQLQKELMAAGYLGEADARYGYITDAAVRGFQYKHGLARDGVAGAETITALQKVNEGEGFVFHRVRPGETIDQIALSLGVTPDAICRHNRLRRKNTVPAGALLAMPSRVILVENGATPAKIQCTAILGPRLDLVKPIWPEETMSGPNYLPVLGAEDPAWPLLLRRRDLCGEIAGTIKRLGREHHWQGWAIDLPGHLWRHGRRVETMLHRLAGDGGFAFCPIIHWPGRNEPIPRLAGLAGLADFILLDPGEICYDSQTASRILRMLVAKLGPHRLILILRPGGLTESGGKSGLVSVSEARVAAASAHARLAWDEKRRVYQALHGGGEPCQQLLLLEQRGLRERTRLADRFNLAGVAFGALSDLKTLPAENWPGEFHVMDNFPAARHIDYKGKTQRHP